MTNFKTDCTVEGVKYKAIQQTYVDITGVSLNTFCIGCAAYEQSNESSELCSSLQPCWQATVDESGEPQSEYYIWIKADQESNQ